MMRRAVNSIDNLNSLMIVGAYFAAHFIPFDLLVFSYVFLGPAHYITEISWLYDKKYFLKKETDVLLLAIICLLMFFFGNLYLTLIGFTLCYFLMAVTNLSASNKWILSISYGIVLLAFSATPQYLALVSLLPTLIHVYIFTAGFMLLAILKKMNPAGLVSFALLMTCGLSFFLPGIYPQALASSIFTEIDLSGLYTSPIMLFNLQPGYEWINRLAGFAAFAYTYHYLNWFSKVEIIKWHRISRLRLVVLTLIYFSLVSIYIYDANFGLKVILFLSFSHVILELPLNAVCFSEIAQTLIAVLRGRKTSG